MNHVGGLGAGWQLAAGKENVEPGVGFYVLDELSEKKQATWAELVHHHHGITAFWAWVNDGTPTCNASSHPRLVWAVKHDLPPLLEVLSLATRAI